ncbi:MAG: amidohydrolase family protein [Candidatus Thorarchaeota archaeon]
MNFVEGMIYQESGFINGYLEFDDGVVTEVCKGRYPKHGAKLAKGVILPLLTNCHTHLGDAVAHGRHFKGDIESLVAPPNGLKFKILRESTSEDLINAMNKAIIHMLNTGTGSFIDFREGGLTGIKQLQKAANVLPINTFIIGRPKSLNYSKDEINSLLDKVMGIGISSITDWDYDQLEKISQTIKQNKKIFALHASERLHENLDKILDLNPDFLVHMTCGTDSDFETLAELGIPVVICPRSRIFFNNIPNISKMLNKGVTLVLGSDNAMFNSPNMFDELKVGFKLANKFGTVKPKTMLKMITINTKKVLNPKYHISLAPGSPSNFMVLDIPMENPEQTLIHGIKTKSIKIVNILTSIWKKL